MKEIPLSRNMVAIVDDEDYDFLMQWNWYAHKNSECCNTFYAVRSVNHRKPGIKCEKMHRVIMGATDSKLKVDHIDHNGLNNTRSNLRICTHSENLMNRKNGFGKSQFKGAIWDKSRGKFQARIKANGKTINLGRYDTDVEAAKVYNEAALKYHGQYACLNTI